MIAAGITLAVLWLLAGFVIALLRIDWGQAFVAKWQGLMDRDGRVRVCSTRTGVTIVFVSLMTCWPFFLWAWRRRAPAT